MTWPSYTMLDVLAVHRDQKGKGSKADASVPSLSSSSSTSSSSSSKALKKQVSWLLLEIEAAAWSGEQFLFVLLDSLDRANYFFVVLITWFVLTNSLKHWTTAECSGMIGLLARAGPAPVNGLEFDSS